MNVLYTAVASANNGRDGRVKSDDATIDLPLAVPKSMGGPGGAGTNPEQLFAAGYSACFGSALKLVAGMQKVRTGPVTISAHVSLGKTDQGGYKLAVELVGTMPELAREEAEKLMHTAHQVCPYSNATRGNIDVKLSVASA